MKYVRLLPPGSICNHHAIKDIISRSLPEAKTFIDVGCGIGDLSEMLLNLNFSGTGIDPSAEAIKHATQNLKPQIEAGQYKLLLGDAASAKNTAGKHDFGVSNMVMEHINDDIGFVKECCSLVKPGGLFIFAVPSHMNLWSTEDDTVGHLRRYNRESLTNTLEKGGLINPKVYSVAVPISNILFLLSKLVIRLSNEKSVKSNLTKDEQTQHSGIREIPWKTVFPKWVNLVLNSYTLYPVIVLQRLFYKSNLGVVMIGWGKVKP